MPQVSIPCELTGSPEIPQASRTPDLIAPLVHLLANENAHPYVMCRSAVSAQSVAAWLHAYVANLVSNGRKRLRLVQLDGQIVAAAYWTPLPWDSSHFGFPAGRLDFLVARGLAAKARPLKSDLVAALLRDCASQTVKHLTARVGAHDSTAIGALEAAGFEPVDGIQTFSFAPSTSFRREISSGSIRVGLCQAPDVAQVVELARTSFRLDRFHADPALGEGVADRLHADWVRNSCAGVAADAVFVARDGEKALGFCTIRIDHELWRLSGTKIATIVLVATDELARGRGIGRQLVQAAVNWSAAEGVALVQVGTQVRNTVAARLYESSGFEPMGASLTYRRIL